MREDPVFKERFGISTPIRYCYDVKVMRGKEKEFQRAWSRFYKKMEPNGGVLRRQRFNAFLKKLHQLGDDLPFTKQIEIRYISKLVGYGVFAKVAISPNCLLNHYGGVLKPEKKIPLKNDSVFMFSDFPSYSIDATKEGNWTRFMNHSSEKSPHTNVIAWEHYTKEGPHIIFTAGKKGIKKGAQLLYSYGDSYWEEEGFEAL